ncbi:MAG: hypothetical protein KGZ67_14230 [Hydrogenophaga sp.]|jgi:signal transduction protein with GAF and PtsI domain|nr:hypothetical protein [Hydrogenophaga sp.]
MSTAARLVLMLLIGLAIGATAGWQVQGWRQGRIDAQRIERQARDTLRNIERGQQAADTYTQEQAHVQPTRQQITRTVERIVTRDVYRNVCFDDGGMRELRAAIATGAPSGGAAEALPADHATD